MSSPIKLFSLFSFSYTVLVRITNTSSNKQVINKQQCINGRQHRLIVADRRGVVAAVPMLYSYMQPAT